MRRGSLGRYVFGKMLAAASSYATVGSQTVTAEDVINGIIVVDPAGAGRTYTWPTAALLVAALPNPQIGDVIKTLVVNGADAAEVLTIGAGTGGGFDTNQVAASRNVGQNGSKIVHTRLTGVAVGSEAYVMYV
jgi:hypothetical protein